MKSPQLINTALIALAVAGLSASPMSLAAKKDMEKCAGIVKAGKNDCGTSKHSCSAQAASDADAEEWVYLPKGICEKIVGGTVVKSK